MPMPHESSTVIASVISLKQLSKKYLRIMLSKSPKEIYGKGRKYAGFCAKTREKTFGDLLSAGGSGPHLHGYRVVVST